MLSPFPPSLPESFRLHEMFFRHSRLGMKASSALFAGITFAGRSQVGEIAYQAVCGRGPKRQPREGTRTQRFQGGVGIGGNAQRAAYAVSKREGRLRIKKQTAVVRASLSPCLLSRDTSRSPPASAEGREL